MRVRKGKNGKRVLALNKREQATLEKAHDILLEMRERLESRLIDLGSDDGWVSEDLAEHAPWLDAAQVNLSWQEETDWPEPEDMKD